MSDAPETHYLNAEFDLGLRPRSRLGERPTLQRQVGELSVQGFLGARTRDAVLVRGRTPESFLRHLKENGMPVPRVLLHPEIDTDSILRPFGWSHEAMELNLRHRNPAAHPSPQIIRRVNSRSFAQRLEEQLFPGALRRGNLTSLASLEAFLSKAEPTSQWVIKSEHGNSGLANRRLKRPRLSAADRRFVAGLLDEDDGLIIESWQDRERDWGVVFRVPFEEQACRVHESFCTRDGAFIGAIREPGNPADTPLKELHGMARQVASRLEAEGYFGPVCVDAFSWRDGSRRHLRPFVDLNARYSMTDGAFRLCRRIAPERACYYRFFNRRKFALPNELPAAQAALDGLQFDPSRKQGIFLASPTSYIKLAVIFIAEDRAGAFAQERWFRNRFES